MGQAGLNEPHAIAEGLAAPARWRPSAFIKASAALHVVAIAYVAMAPASWPWWLAVIVADHLALTAAGLLPRSSLLGPNIRRLPERATARNEVALTFDDGPDPQVTPAVLDLLDAYGMKASFFLVADRARKHSELVRDIVARGHSIENHSERHAATFSFWGLRKQRRDIERSQDALKTMSGHIPRFFRPPAGLRNPFLEPALVRCGLRLASWTRRGYDGVMSDSEAVYVRLTQGLAPGDILLLHDGNVVRGSGGKPVVLEVLPRLLQTLSARGLRSVSLPQAFD